MTRRANDDRRRALLARVLRGHDSADLLSFLAERLPASDLRSLLLHVMEKRSQSRSPRDLVAQHERDRLVQPACASPLRLLEIERAAFAASSGFEPIELSPVAPLGINRVLGEISQNNVLSTIRNAEVMADPTTAQALECARRRRAGQTDEIRLSARSRQVRLQPTDNPSFTPHFELFSLVTAGRAEPSWGFELRSLREHVRVYLALLAALSESGYAFSDVTVSVADSARDARRLGAVERSVFPPLAAEFPDVKLALDHERTRALAYYRGLCLAIDATDPLGVRHNLADGGVSDWIARLLSNDKERSFVSGIGSELIAKRFVRA